MFSKFFIVTFKYLPSSLFRFLITFIKLPVDIQTNSSTYLTLLKLRFRSFVYLDTSMYELYFSCGLLCRPV